MQHAHRTGHAAPHALCGGLAGAAAGRRACARTACVCTCMNVYAGEAEAPAKAPRGGLHSTACALTHLDGELDFQPLAVGLSPDEPSIHQLDLHIRNECV